MPGFYGLRERVWWFCARCICFSQMRRLTSLGCIDPVSMFRAFITSTLYANTDIPSFHAFFACLLPLTRIFTPFAHTLHIFHSPCTIIPLSNPLRSAFRENAFPLSHAAIQTPRANTEGISNVLSRRHLLQAAHNRSADDNP